MIQKSKTLQLVGTGVLVFTASILSISPVLAEDGKEVTTKDMSTITCADFLAMEPDKVSDTLVWYDGWLSKEAGEPVYDYDTETFGDYQDSVVTACEDNQGDLLIDTVTDLNQ